MRIGSIGSSTVMPRTTRQGAAAPGDAASVASRALIPVAASAPGERSPAITRRPLAAFLAHLIATQTQAPQTRVRRRAEPEEAEAAYGTRVQGRGRARGKLDYRA